jgi:hypothetical protein
MAGVGVPVTGDLTVILHRGIRKAVCPGVYPILVAVSAENPRTRHIHYVNGRGGACVVVVAAHKTYVFLREKVSDDINLCFAVPEMYKNVRFCVFFDDFFQNICISVAVCNDYYSHTLAPFAYNNSRIHIL